MKLQSNDEWLTPPGIIDKLGSFDLDPCTPDIMPWKTAEMRYIKKDDGLSKMWMGRVWLNPPFGNQQKLWLKRMVDHGNGIALIHARVEMNWFHDLVWNSAYAVLFLKGRLTFYYVNGKKAGNNSGSPIALVAYEQKNAEVLKQCDIRGKYIHLNALGIEATSFKEDTAESPSVVK